MNYLIDGHNLIGKMGDISLSDPDDELQLVRRLQRWVARDVKRHVLVIFDGGVRAGKDPHLSSARLQIFFAPAEQSADTLLVRRINRVKNPVEYTLISSDRAILAAAAAKKMPFLRAEQFATQIGLERKPATVEALDEDESDNPQLTEAEITEWLALFGPVPDRPPSPPPSMSPRLPSSTKSVTPLPPPRPHTVGEYKTGLAHLAPQEIEEWITLFGHVPESSPPLPPTKKRDQRLTPKPDTSLPTQTYKSGQGQLSAAEIEEWLNWFGGEDPNLGKGNRDKS